MRGMMVAILMTCLGILLPVAAVPLHVCLLDPAEQSLGCCDDCLPGEKDCCRDVEALPDAPMPGESVEAPAFVGFAVAFFTLDWPAVSECPAPPGFAATAARAGPTSARLAVLNVWRI